MIGKRSKQNRAGLLNASFGAMLSMLVTFVGFMPPPVAAASYNPVPLTPRHGATATVLEDGTILIAGGKSGGTFVEAVEIYNPATGDISTVAGGISRTGHTATRLADGKVLVAGGSNDGSFEVYNGDIQVLKSGFNAKANALNSSNTIDEVLNAQTRASIIYDYPADSLPVDPASDIGDLLNRHDYAMAEVPQTGMNPPKILVAGGERGGVAVETAYVFDGSPAQITTGATDYAPGTPVKLNSSGWTGWQNNETVNLVLHKEKDGQASDIPLISLNVNDQGKLIGDRLLDSVTAWIAKHLKLRANVNKSGVGRPWNGKFLGFRMTRNGKVGPAKASLDKLKAEVRRHWNAQLSLKLEDRVIGWQRYIRGWWNYFCLCEYRRPIIILESWMRRHMRKYFWQRWHNRQGRLHALRRLKAKPYHLKQASGSVGTWRLARSPMLQTVLNNARLRRWGLWVPSDFATP